MSEQPQLTGISQTRLKLTCPDYSLWLVPTEPARTVISRLIAHLSSLETTSPVFLPHITLWSPVPITQPVDQITSTLESIVSRLKTEYPLSDLQLPLKQATTGDQYFQSVLAPVQPIDALLGLRRACEAEWGPATKDYFPHLSLFYGEATDARRKEITKAANEVEGEENGEMLESVTIGEIAVVDVRGMADGWKVVGRVKL